MTRRRDADPAIKHVQPTNDRRPAEDPGKLTARAKENAE
jgi:hypothetical protein